MKLRIVKTLKPYAKILENFDKKKKKTKAAVIKWYYISEEVESIIKGVSIQETGWRVRSLGPVWDNM